MAHDFEISLDFEACKGCGYCLEVCPGNVFDPGGVHNGKGYRPPVAARPGDCLGCQGCFMACPDFCLEVLRASGKG
ncbi:MAG: ferredoxin family protein [Deltaproteobacteria bacterium]|jgi:2-oxoglutarate ferredoxin oxidoreductase subunit delta|nr:ferredoxin family protein [Deltaproteobacteria bacterium]